MKVDVNYFIAIRAFLLLPRAEGADSTYFLKG